MTKTRTRIGSILLVVAMLLTLLPTTAMAVGTTHEVASEDALQEAIASAQDGDIIQLTEDIAITPVDSGSSSLNPHITINKDLTLNLNGKKISWDLTDITKETEYTCTIAFFAVDGADVTITGNGIIDTEAYYNNSYGINIINGGK